MNPIVKRACIILLILTALFVLIRIGTSTYENAVREVTQTQSA